MSQFPRTLFLTSYINRGGTSRVTMDLVQFLQDRGHEVAMALSSRGPHAIDEGETFRTFVFDYPKRIPGTGRIQTAVQTRIRKAWFKRVVGRFDPEVIFVVSLFENDFDLATEIQTPCVAHIHAIHHDFMVRSLPYLNKLSSFADRYVASSQTMADRLCYNLGIPKEKVSFLYNGVPIQKIGESAKADPQILRKELGIGEDEVVVAGCGAVNYVKGPDIFLRVADSVRRHSCSGVPWRFVWIGEKHCGVSPIWTGCRNLLDELDLGAKVHFVGHRADIVSFLRDSDLFLVTSRAESLPLAMMEAMALGKPIVAFPVGGVHEALSHGGGFVTDGRTPEEMGRTVASLIDDIDLRNDIGRQAQSTIQSRFDSEQLFVRFEDLLTEVADCRDVDETSTVFGELRS